MKIGILTYTSNFNFGTFFQAYAGLCSVRRAFPEAQVEIVNCHSAAKYQRVGYGRLNLKKRHLYPPFLIRHLRGQQRYRACQKRYLELDAGGGFHSDSYRQSADYLKAHDYDLLLVGSDTVLNFYDWDHAAQEPPMYWLPSDLPCTKAMLAASIGTDLKLAQLDEPMREKLRQSAAGFALLGVRDPMTRDFLLDLDPQLEHRIRMVPDPTFSLNVDGAPALEYLQRRRIDPQTPLIGMDLPLSVPGVAEAVQYFKAKGYRVASWRGKSVVADYDFSDMGPMEWAGMFAHYSITLTNRFHASVFSLKSLTPVIAMDCKSERVAESGLSKTSLLLESFGMKDSSHRNAQDIMEVNWLREAMTAHLTGDLASRIGTQLKRFTEEYSAYLQEVIEQVLPSRAAAARGRK